MNIQWNKLGLAIIVGIGIVVVAVAVCALAIFSLQSLPNWIGIIGSIGGLLIFFVSVAYLHFTSPPKEKCPACGREMPTRDEPGKAEALTQDPLYVEGHG